MHDYLRELCSIADIELTYNENKMIVLSSTIKNGKPILRAHYIFSNATREIAKLVVSYYTGMDSTSEGLALLSSFAVNMLETSKVRIIPPDIEFINFFKKSTEAKINDAIEKQTEKNEKSEDENIEEVQIKSIIEKDFYGNISSESYDNKINTGKKDFIELDIVIERYKA